MAQAAIDGVLVVDKAAGMTSHDVVSRARRAFGTRSVGHAGTLDPAATGVLVLGVGQGTKLLAYLTADDKTYETEIALGAETDTLDADGEVVERASLLELGQADVREIARRYVGTLRQRAPIVSAIKVDGRPLHQRARRGEAVEAPVREVVVHELELLEIARDRVTLRVHCGKGFYVRSLARDLARDIGTVGHVAALRRTRSGSFGIDAAVDYSVLAAAASGGTEARRELERRVLSLIDAWAPRPTAALTTEGLEDARHGRPVSIDRVAGAPAGADPVALIGDGRLVAIGRREGDALRILRGFSP